MRFWNMVNVLCLAFVLAACGENEGPALSGSASVTGAYGTTDLFLPDEAGQIDLLTMPERQMRLDEHSFEYTGSMQTFTVTKSGSYRLEAYGAEGGTSTGQSGGTMYPGGKGAAIKGSFSLNAGDTLSILVGQRGTDSNCGSGGGGGTFIALNGNPLVIAGGGGGGFHCNAIGGVDGIGGVDSQNGTAGICGALLERYPAPGGTGGNGGSSHYGGGGGGWLTDGYSGADSNARGRAYPGVGGNPGGGYGGGGGYYPGCCGGSGGGGGYSGGGGGQSDGCAGGGGGSYNNGADQENAADIQEGNGLVRIVDLCPGVTPDPTDVTATPATVDFGGTARLNATTSGTTIKWYTEASGGEPIGESASGDDFEVSPTETTTYYAEASGVPSTQVKSFSYKGSVQTWIVPAGITSIQIETWGAAGWSGDNVGGKGGYAKGTLAVTPGETLYLYVGGKGTVADVPYAPMGGGWNGGGHGQNNDNGDYAGGGGGASDVRIGGTTLADRIIVAGGGGGATGNTDCWGGNGGGETGADGGCSDDYEVGTGGTQSEGGTIGGALGKGGSAKSTMEPWNGGGGGGYYGGGTSPAHGSGGGGSSYIGGVTDGETTAGVRSGHGQITITYTDASISACPSSRIPVTVTVGTYAFTNCAQTGATGPTQDQCDTAYTDTALAGAVTIDTQGIQEWVVPVTGTYRIEAYGAEGGTSTGENGSGPYVGGKGAVIKGDFSLNAGDTLHILVGQKGSDSNCGSGGGGGTFIVKDGDPLIVAGGGGGGFHCVYYGSALGGGGQTGTSGQDGICAPDTNPPRTGGTGGNGGTSYYGAGGGGWLTAGTSDADSGSNAGAYPGDGGVPGGAYGGGGGYYGSCCGGSGAGGGYSGGSGGTLDGCAGGGGGSYNDGADQDNVAGANAGDGKVIITSLCVNLPDPTDVIAKPVSLSSGESVQLNATTVPDSMIVWYTDETGGVSIGSSFSGEDFEVSPTAETTYYAEAVPVVYVENTVDLDYTGAVQTWTVPAGVTSIEIEVSGAQGGGGSGGLGARIKGTVPVTPGETIKYIVGGQGTLNYGAGGGGGSFVTRADNTPLVIAGGGGGQDYDATDPGQPGRTETTGGSVGGASGGADGAGGANGGGSSGCGWFGSGGGGLLTNGSISGDGGGNSFISGGAISVEPAANCVNAGLGGFGGGGAGGNGGGGGGGYSGGAGGTNGDGYLGGAGGGSYNSGTDQTNEAGVRSGNGKITIKYMVAVPDPTRCPSKRVPVTVSMCDARVDGPTVIATPDTIANGSSALLNATATGATISWYAEEFGGVAIGTSASGEDFEVFPTATTTYYAEASDSDPTHCPSLRVPVTVTIKAAPGAECGLNDDCLDGYCTDGVCCGVETCDDDNVCTVDSCAVAGDGTCTNTPGNAGTECRGAAGFCDVAEVCDGVNADCPEDVLVTADTNTECRDATGLCDVAEICNGFLIDCPEDDVAAADVVCRPQDGLCDVADNCDGETAECPAYDAVATADVVCRSKDGDCDLDDNCDGTTKDCTEKFVDAGTECRATAGVCDVAEKCTGAASACPVDAFAGSSTVCRVSVGICDASEYCSGGGVSCPAENYASVNGGTCDDGDVLTQNDVCLDGGCAGELRTGICGNEMAVGALPYTVSGDTGGRLNTLDTYGTACANASQPTGDIVYALDVTEGVEYQIQVVPAAGFDAALNLLNVCGESEICIGAANTGTDGATEVILYTADHTGTIYIAVEGGGAGEAGAFELNVAVVEQSDDDTIVTDDTVTDDITTDEIAGDSDELSGDSDELLVDADEVVTDEVVTDETVTDNETPDETTDETVTDNETPDETADEAGDGLVTDEDDLLTDETLTDTDKPADEACSCSMVF